MSDHADGGATNHEDPPFGTFEKVVLAVAAGAGEDASILELSRSKAVFVRPRALGAVRIVCLRFEPGPSLEERRRELKQLIAASAPLPLDLVLVGGEERDWKLLRRARPFYTPTRVGLVQIDERLALRSDRPMLAGKLLSPVSEKVAPVTAEPATWSMLLARSASSREAGARQSEQASHFAALFKQRKPVATWAIAGLIGAVYALQLYLGGGSDAPPLLVRMGALVRDRVFAGEWWRLLSCTFLHGGAMHVLLNVYVLIVLGSFLERIIGPARFLILYVISAIAGSIGSALLLKAGFSVGASGAVWGLLGAHAILAYRSGGLLPESLVPGARRAALINLGLNVVNSFRPNVDLWAHFAGGGAGALLFASGLLTRGLPKLSEGDEGSAGPRPVPTPRSVWVLGVIAAALLVAGPTTALFIGKPHLLSGGAPLAERELGDLGVALSLPAGASHRVERSPHGPTLIFGDLISDPMTVAVFALPTPPLDASALAREMASLKGSLAPPASSRQHEAPATFTRGGETGLTVSYSYPSKLILERAFLFLPTRLVRVEVLRWPQLGTPQGIARKLVESARVL